MFKARLFTAAIAALTAVGVAPAAAQETGQVGLVMRSGSSVGLTIQAGGRVVIRPEVAFLRSSSELDGLGDERTSTGWAPGISLLFNLKSWDTTSLYLSPQWTYARVTNNDDETGIDAKSTSHSLSAMIGAQHNLGSRFAVFGEVGLGWSRAKGGAVAGFGDNKATTWTTRSTAGGILFF